MSLLEDIFLGDEADEAQELERVIDGDDYDERRPVTPNSNENSEKEDEAEEDKRRVDPTQTKSKRIVKNPRFVLNPARLTGPRGIQVIPDHFKDFKFKGKGREKEDLDLVLKKLEHWAYRLYPKFQFQDCLKKIETLGKKRPVMVHLHKIRTDQFVEEPIVQRESSDDEEPVVQEEDEFDKLLQQQIDLARATPAPASVRKTRTPDRSLIMPKATSSPSISDEQRERMLKNRRFAEERRLAKPNKATGIVTPSESINESSNKEAYDENNVKKHNRSQIIDSSDEETEVTAVSHSISIEIHKDTHRNYSPDKQLDSGKDTEHTNCDVIENDVHSEIGNQISYDDSNTLEESNKIEKPNNSGMHIDNSRNNTHRDSEEDKNPTRVLENDSGDNANIEPEVKDSDFNKELSGQDSLNTVDNNAHDIHTSVENSDSDNVKLSSDTDKIVETEVMDVDFSEDF